MTGRAAGGKNKKDIRQIVWACVRAAVFITLICFFFANKDFFVITTDGGMIIRWKRVLATVAGSAVAVLIPCFVRWNWPRFVKKWMIRLFYVLLTGVVLLLALYMCEYIHGFQLFAIRKLFIACNLILAVCLFLIIYIVSNRFKWSMLLTYTLLVDGSAVNYYVNVFRGEAISAADLFTVGTAANVADEYVVVMTWPFFVSLAVGALILTLLTWLPKEEPLFTGRKRLLLDAGAAVFSVFFIWVFAISPWPATQHIRVRLDKPMTTYQENGEWLNFTRSFYGLFVSAPDGYSAASCKELMDSLSYESDPAADAASLTQSPNIIFIMNESLTDFSVYDELGLSEDPMPFIHSLQGKSNAITGNLHVDVFGGHTANTEYELLTGNSLFNLPDGAIPYSMFVRSPQPSINSVFSAAGYCGNEAFHPYLKDGYSRPRAYENLGFDRYVALEDIQDRVTDADYLRSRISDEADFRFVRELYEEARSKSDAPYYLMNVTMQNHGPYTKDFDNFEQDINITSEKFLELSRIKLTKRFINLTQYSDEAFEKLAAYFEQVDEPTILVMFGDHLPNFHGDFYKTLWGRSEDNLEGADQFKKYTTPLVIWANYDINPGGKYDEQFDEISINYLSAAVMDIAGVPMSAYGKFLAAMQKEIPVITNHGILSSDGTYYEPDAESWPFDDWIRAYRYLAYNYQFDKSGRIDSYFTLRE